MYKNLIKAQFPHANSKFEHKYVYYLLFSLMTILESFGVEILRMLISASKTIWSCHSHKYFLQGTATSKKKSTKKSNKDCQLFSIVLQSVIIKFHNAPILTRIVVQWKLWHGFRRKYRVRLALLKNYHENQTNLI